MKLEIPTNSIIWIPSPNKEKQFKTFMILCLEFCEVDDKFRRLLGNLKKNFEEKFSCHLFQKLHIELREIVEYNFCCYIKHWGISDLI